MHNLAIALHKKGYRVTGSDDEVFEPSKSRLKNQGLLPEREGWYPENITPELDAVTLAEESVAPVELFLTITVAVSPAV